MRQKLARVAMIAIFGSLVSGCTWRQLYNTAQAYQRSQCQERLDQTERDQCLSRTNMTYDDYSKQKESGSK